MEWSSSRTSLLFVLLDHHHQEKIQCTLLFLLLFRAFYHVGRQSVMTFDFEQLRETVCESTKWTESIGHAQDEALYDEKEELQTVMGKYRVEVMTTLRAWTCTVIYFVLTEKIYGPWGKCLRVFFLTPVEGRRE
jgi:hypothetical protein